MAHEVFVSYSHKNKPMADAVCATLEQNGIRCWYAPRDIEPGREWAECIIQGIESCSVFILLFSDYSNASNQVLREVSKAVSSQKTIIPVKVTDTVPSGGMEYYLNTVHWLDMLDSPLQDRLKALLVRVDAVLGQEREASGYIIPDVKRFWKKPRLPYILSGAALLVAALAVMLMFSSGLLRRPSASQGEDPSSLVPFTVSQSEDELGTSLSNANNGGIAATDGEYIYYQSNDYMSLYRMRSDGSEKQQLSSMAARSINVWNGMLYFCQATNGMGKICRMPATGGELELLLELYVENLVFRNGLLYFNNCSDGLKLYALSPETRQLMRLGNRKVLGALVDDYYSYYLDKDGAEYICRSAYDGSGAEAISKFPARDPSLCGHTLVFMQVLPNGNSELVLLDTHTLEQTIVSRNISLNGINVTPEGLYGWYGREGRYALCRVNLDGTVTDLLALEGSITDVCVAGDWVFFVNNADNYRVWAVGTDGSEAGPV